MSDVVVCTEQWKASEKHKLQRESSGKLLDLLIEAGKEMGRHDNAPVNERGYSYDAAMVEAEAAKEILLDRCRPQYCFPELGDDVETTEIAPNLGEKATPAQVQKVKLGTVEVTYGVHEDRAIVSIKSCSFNKRGKL